MSLSGLLVTQGAKVVAVDTLLPIVVAQVHDLRIFESVKGQPFVDYVEPLAVSVPGGVTLESGCNLGTYDGPSPLVPALPTGDIVPWNYTRMKIDSAWARQTGQGVTVGLVDTGIDVYNPEFGVGSSVNAPGRTIEFHEAYDGPGPVGHDLCGHGTRMASVIAAPADGRSIVGAAWRANVVSAKVDDDVLMFNAGRVREAIRIAASRARIVTIAYGIASYYWQSIADELAYWYQQDRIIFAAAGTSPCWVPYKEVVFPAYLPSVYAVTALTQSGAIDCQAHRGPAVAFAAFVPQQASGLTSGAAVQSLGGSSAASAIVAGIAALALQRNPSATRTQLIGTLIRSASTTGALSSQVGWGTPDALCVSGGLCQTWIDGPSLVESSGYYRFTARFADPSTAPMISWSTGEASQIVDRWIHVRYGADSLIAVSVTVTDPTDGRQRTATKYVVVRDPYSACPTCF
jgi:subtilisin family serine protease